MFSIFCVSDIISDITEVKYKYNKVLFVKSIEDVLEKENISVVTPIIGWIIDYYIKTTTGDIQKLLKSINNNVSAELLDNRIIIHSENLLENIVCCLLEKILAT